MSAALIVQLVLAVLAGLPQLIEAIETLHSQSGAGPIKKGLVLDLVAKALTVAGTADPKLAKLLTPDLQAKIQELTGGAVDSAVTLMNADAPKPGG